ncbi:MAG: glycosyltransferase [Kiritimatiellia bacterium]
MIFSTAAQLDRMVGLHPAPRRAHTRAQPCGHRSLRPEPDRTRLRPACGRPPGAPENTGLLLRAARLPPGVRLAVAGTGSEEPALKAFAAGTGLKVDWLGSVPHARLPDLMNRSRVYVLPSLYEGLPKTLIEALSCGMAVAATRAPGIREVLRDGETGLLAEAEPAALAAAPSGACSTIPIWPAAWAPTPVAKPGPCIPLPSIARREAALLRRVAGVPAD